MSENTMDLLGTAKELVGTSLRIWADVDLDEQDYLDRLASFGEGFCDLSRFHEVVNTSGEIDVSGT